MGGGGRIKDQRCSYNHLSLKKVDVFGGGGVACVCSLAYRARWEPDAGSQTKIHTFLRQTAMEMIRLLISEHLLGADER